MKSTNYSFWSKGQMLILLLIMFIDGVGMSLVLPLIGTLFSTGKDSILTGHYNQQLSTFFYATSLAGFSGAMIIGAACLGQLSDRLGRKVTLQYSLLGALAGYIICALSIPFKAPFLFITGRVIDGLTAGSIPIAQAMMTDLDSPDNSMSSIGKVMFAVTSGYMFGPLIAHSAFSQVSQSLWWLPFLIIASLCLLCLIFLSFMKETAAISNDSTKKVDWMLAARQLRDLFSIDELRSSLLAFFMFQCAWTLFYQYLPRIIAYQQTQHISGSLLLTEVGIAMCFAFCVLVSKLQAKYSPQKIVIICCSLFSLLSCGLALNLNSWSFQFISILMATLYAVGYSAMLASLMMQADDAQKGLILGSVASICALSATITAIFGTTISTLGYYTFVFLLLIAGISSLYFYIMSHKDFRQLA